MSKKNKKSSAKIVKLSPESFFRKKARNLSIHKCYISEEWEEHGECNILIERKHGNGHITLGMFLVDLYCLGVKDTFYQYNISPSEEEEFFQNMSGNDNLVETDYNLVHNIILASVEFAEDYGFKPHKDFERVTQFLIEKDTDEIPLIDIECGKHGKPFFIASEDMNEKEKSRIISTLERTAGRDNFNYILNDDDDFNFVEDGIDEGFVPSWDLIDEEAKERWKEIFLEGMESGDGAFNEDEEFILETAEIINNLYDEKIDEEYESLNEAFCGIQTMVDAVPDEFLGLQYATAKDDVEQARELVLKLSDYQENLSDLSKKLMKVAPNLPVSHYFRIKYEQYEGKKKRCFKLLKNALTKFPDYRPFELLKLHLLDLDDDFEIPEEYLTLDMSAIYHGRHSFFRNEVEEIFTVILMWYLLKQNVPAVFAIRKLLTENQESFSLFYLGFVYMVTNVLFMAEIQHKILLEDPQFAEKVENYLE